MSKMLLFCPETPGLTLGPSEIPAETIKFKAGWATFDSDDFPEWETWVNHPGTPRIEVIPSDSDEVAPAAVDAHICPVCGKGFKPEIAKKGHMRSHAPKV